ncbi:hypothetical protein [Streptomyces sp. NPDC051572]|uniref:hypothetical protein n=1 Tax=Streptomyces sp. NPDC051572 TaxID=3155802 RepID=UPI00344EA5C7
MTVTLFGTVADPAHHAMTANLCAVAAAPARSATSPIPRGTLAATTRHPMTANLDAAVAEPARPTTSPIPHAPDTPAPHRRPTSRAPHHCTPPPVAHPKGTPCR